MTTKEQQSSAAKGRKTGEKIKLKLSKIHTEKKKMTTKDKDNMIWWLAFGVVVFLTAATRLYKIEEPDHVCWDETHFGKMGSWYINHTFFFDVHPPLGKILIGMSGKLTGYNGTFPFNKPGDKYGEHNYIGMRLFCVTLGALIVPFSFLIVWEMTHSVAAALLSASFIMFDVGVLTLSQYILLDPILKFFIIGSVLGMVRFSTKKNRPFSFSWWFWLAWTGVFLACSISVKFVGLFVILLVGIHTVVDLWELLGNLDLSMVQILKHFIARVLCLIILPGLLYTLFFYIHLHILYKSGTGDGFFSSAFQSQLEGNSLYHANMPREVAYGAIITLKNHRTGGGYLHSHWHLYPEGVGARQQQVTAYSHKDDNNKWLIKKFDDQPQPSSNKIELIKNGDLVRLEHLVTTRNIHSHKEMAPVTKRHQQVTCYGENGTGDANDVWKVEVEGGVKGFEQMEVTCNPNVRDKNNIWNVEDNIFPLLPNVSFEVYAPSFLERFFESHAVMFQGNSGLKPKEGEVTSRPWQWPINFRGQFFSGHQYRIYLLGNPIIWWGNLVLMGVYLLVQGIIALRHQRGYLGSPKVEGINSSMSHASMWLFLAWSLHYFPFYGMGRILYFHHYFPALLFSSMLSGVILDYLLSVIPHALPWTLGTSFYHWLLGTILAGLAYSFYLFSPLSYGMEGPPSSSPNSTMYGLRWLESWEF
ncbi:protein O-mannosyl-transferase 2-like [Limulus polyphemus]|uniref:Protein O-mannosyl-transferase 2 n=1 Tax=Limulus polyphemus TaxID=6850 RepID=A0ABM1SCI6_LIMPO|nr:protein O-mannosyl-transferase 2-like [Limulus polyphemus]